ncbi:MAG: alpha/beta fold hydrolase [Phycisphaerae bacterium]
MGLDYSEIDKEIDRDLGITQPRDYASLKKFWGRVKWVLKPFWWLTVGIYKILTFPVVPVLSIANYRLPDAATGVIKVPLYRRVLEGLVTRLLLTPFILAAFLIFLVWYTTHPLPVIATQTPNGLGLFYRPVTLESSDGHMLNAWYIPGMTMEEVVRNGDEALLERRPAAILVHGLGYGQDQYLTLASRLHETGFAVLMISMRGQGNSSGGAAGNGGITFGLRERLDVLAAVGYLRELPQVDSNRIAVVGYGMGASAALQAAVLDHAIAAVVIENPWPSFAAWSQHNFDRPWVPSGTLTTLYQTAFELWYRERVSQLDMAASLRHLHQTHVFMIIHNQPGQAPVADLLAAAQKMPGPHTELVLDENDERGTPSQLAATITGDLAEAMKWTPAQRRLSENLKRLIGARVK